MIAGREDLVAIPYDPDAHPDEWLAARRGGMGGSDLPPIVGEAGEKSAADVWLEKTTELSGFSGNERTETGKDLEPVVLGWYAAGGKRWPRSGEAITAVKPPSVFLRDKPWIRGSVDALLYYPEAIVDVPLKPDNRFVVRGRCLGEDYQRSELLARKPNELGEIKTHGWFGSRGYNLSDEGHPIVSVPPDKRIQVGWYMPIYQVDVTVLICLVDTHLKRAFRLHRDPELEAMLLDAADRFWHGNVLADIPPEPDGTDGYRKFLSNRWKTHGRDYVESTEAVDSATEELIAIKREQKRLDGERELAEQLIKAHIADHEGVRTARGNVSWKFQPSGKLREKEARKELYLVAGWTDAEIEAFEERHRTADIRMLRTPK